MGLGLIGGSIALALREQGWDVCGSDLDDGVSRRAQDEGIISEIGIAQEADITIVAVPVTASVDVVRQMLERRQAW